MGTGWPRPLSRLALAVSESLLQCLVAERCSQEEWMNYLGFICMTGSKELMQAVLTAFPQPPPRVLFKGTEYDMVELAGAGFITALQRLHPGALFVQVSRLPFCLLSSSEAPCNS